MDGKEFYNNMHRDHPDRWEVPNGGHHAFDVNVHDMILAILSFRDEIKLIDLGCGTGRTLELIAHPGLRAVGVDYSEEAIKIAGKRVPWADLMVCDMESVPFENSHFDVVLSVGSHEHQEVLDFSEPRRLVDESGGYFIAVFPCISKVSKGRTIAADGQHYDWDLNQQDWINAVEKFGFKFIGYKEPWTFIFKPA